MSEQNNDKDISETINVTVEKRGEVCNDHNKKETPSVPKEILQNSLFLVPKREEDDIGDDDETPPRPAIGDGDDYYDLMRTPVYVPNYDIKEEHCDTRAMGIIDPNTKDGNTEISEQNVTNNKESNNCASEFERDQEGNNNVNVECENTSDVQNYEEVPEDFFNDFHLQIKSEPSEQVIPEKVSNAEVININVTPSETSNNNNKNDAKDSAPTGESYEVIPEDFFDDFDVLKNSYQVKKETSIDDVPRLKQATHNGNGERNPDINEGRLGDDIGNTTQNETTDADTVSIPDDFFDGLFPVRSVFEPNQIKKEHREYNENNISNVDNRSKSSCRDEIPSSSNNTNNRYSATNDDVELERLRFKYMQELNALSDDEKPCCSRSLKKKKRKHHKQESDDEDNNRFRQSTHDRHKTKSRDDLLDTEPYYRQDRHRQKSRRHKHERRSPSSSSDRLPSKRRREDENRVLIKTERRDGFYNNEELEIVLHSDERKYVTSQPALRIINFNQPISPPPPPVLSEPLEDKIKSSLNRAIKQLKVISSTTPKTLSRNFIFTKTMGAAKSKKSLLSQLNLNPSPLSSNKEFIFALTSIGASVHLSDYGLDQPPALSQYLMRTLGRDINHLNEMRKSTKLPPKISNMIGLANSVKNESKQYQSMLYRDSNTQTDPNYFRKRALNASTQYCDMNLIDVKSCSEKQKCAILMLLETFNTPVFSISEELQQNMRIFEAIKDANRKFFYN